jgi:membrane associated rhomboid family serine protease
MSSEAGFSGKFTSSVKITLVILAVIWMIHLFQVAFGIELYTYGGVYPRSIDGIRGIFLSPFLHGSFMHLINNSAPLAVLLVIILFFYRKVSFQSIFLIYLLTGAAVWLFARPVYHIGASGVVYGLVSFVFWCGIFVRNIKSIVLSLIIAVLYSGMFLGVLPNQEGISWESHLLGGVVGIIVAYLLRHKLRKYEPKIEHKWPEEEKKPYFDRDVFNKGSNDYWRS